MITENEKQVIQEALELEGVPDGHGNLIVPDDFFARLTQRLNPPQPSILDRLIDLASDKK